MKKVLSLFSGCGGMDLGFEGAFKVHSSCINKAIHPSWVNGSKSSWVKLPTLGYETVFANDIRPGAKSAWLSFFGQRRAIQDQIYYLKSIVDLVKNHSSGEEVIFPDGVDVVTGGFPCQDFSIAGKRNGLRSHKDHNGELLCPTKSDVIPNEFNRGMLYYWMREVISIVKPKVFIAENVKGLTITQVHKVIEKDFSSIEAGYHVVPARVLYAPDYGVPQSRERVIFLGFRKAFLKKEALNAFQRDEIPSEFDPYPVKTHGSDRSKAYVPVISVLDDLPEPDDSTDLSQQNYSKAKWFGRHCQGQTEINPQSVGPTIRAEHHGNIEFRRLSPEHGGKIAKEYSFHERRLSVRECARIQTFPDEYKFVQKVSVGDSYNVSASEAYKLIGNAVPPLLGYHIANRLSVIWDRVFKE